MVWVPDWLRPTVRRISGTDSPETAEDTPRSQDRFSAATNTSRRIIEIVRPHLRSGNCLIVTGYQDFFSSLSILLAEVPDIAIEGGPHIRIAFGVDTANGTGFAGRGKSVTEEAKLHFLSRRGLSVEDAADLRAVLAADAIRAGRIDLRIFDPGSARETLGISDDRRLHAKIVASDEGSVAGSANFSRLGLYHNLEWSDGFDVSDEDENFSRAAKERKKFAEQVWEASVDWNREALEILEALLRPVSPEDAAIRLLHEQTSFAPWRMDQQKDVVGRIPFSHQVELVYEASSIVYEHGFVFVESPAGSGKTDVGKHLAWTLSRTFGSVVGSDHTGGLPRGEAMVIAPRRVLGNWIHRAPRTLTAVANSQVGTRTVNGYVGDVEPSHRIDQYGVLIVDESHTVAPGFEESSKRAEAIEYAPPTWTVCISATLLGNKDVDWLAHMQEKRASIFMSPHYLSAMETLFAEEAGLAKLMEGATSEDALSSAARDKLSELLAPFLAHRQRSCIGENSDRSKKDEASYPPFLIHPRPSSLNLSKKQEELMDVIVRLIGELAPGRRVKSVIKSRFGNKAERRHNQNSLFGRNLMNILRSNSAQALWEMKFGAIGKYLRQFEVEEFTRKKKRDPGQMDMFEVLDPGGIGQSPTPMCDALQDRIGSREIQRLDRKRYNEAFRVQKRHRRVVFLAERIDTLQIFAQELARLAEAEGIDHTNFVTGSERADKGADGPSKTEARRAVQEICDTDEPLFRKIKDGHLVESYFRPGGKNAPKGDASVFLTYQMAEGINLQSADALVLLGVTSNLKEIIQGLGRIDRIDSEHDHLDYYLIDVHVGRIASDEKVMQRLANYRSLSGRERVERAEEMEGDTQAILEGVGSYLREPRVLRANNFHDILAGIRGAVDPERYETISGLDISGMWGAELALLDGTEAFTLLHLKGLDGKRGSFAPPRLLKVSASRVVERNQIACARSLAHAYQETVDQELSRVPADQASITRAIEALSARLADLRDWDLRPERTVSLLQSLSVFLSGKLGSGIVTSDQEAKGIPLDEEMFGELTLRGIEYVAETWARLLDPYWILAKKDVRDRFATEAAQNYISIAEVLKHLEQDLIGLPKVRETMGDALRAAREMGLSKQGDVASRVAVVFVSPGRTRH